MVELPTRRPPYIVPQYSLTGDLLAFTRCGLQYRYLNGSALPPSRPVQMWFGEFIHGVMENALLLYRNGDTGFPWDDAAIDAISDAVVQRLASEGMRSRSEDAERFAKRRARIAVNGIGPHLFPLVAEPEVRVRGTRPMPEGADWRARYYEVTGRIDVLTHVTLSQAGQELNPIVTAISRLFEHGGGSPPGPFEVIVDYKGTRRYPTTQREWRLYERQLQTYGWLRERQPGAQPVAAGVLVFINELLPSSNDLRLLRNDIRDGAADVVPVANSEDEQIVLGTARGGESPFGLSWEFRLARALRVVPASPSDQTEALVEFDAVVRDIESCAQQEAQNGLLVEPWPRRPDNQTCVACDFQTTCPDSPYRGPAVTPTGRPHDIAPED